MTEIFPRLFCFSPAERDKINGLRSLAEEDPYAVWAFRIECAWKIVVCPKNHSFWQGERGCDTDHLRRLRGIQPLELIAAAEFIRFLDQV